MSLTAKDLLDEISQYQIGNTDKIFTSKELKKRFSEMDFRELTDFKSSIGLAFSEIKNNPFLAQDQREDHYSNLFMFEKLVNPIANKKMKESLFK